MFQFVALAWIGEDACHLVMEADHGQESVMLFIKMRPGKKFTAALVRRIKEAIGNGLSRRHVPKYVFETHDIPVCRLSLASLRP